MTCSAPRILPTFLFGGVFLCALILFTSASIAQNESVSPAKYAQNIANQCLDNWETLSCYVTVSDSNQVLVTDYIGKLKTAGHANSIEAIRQECAAATAIRRFLDEGGKNLPVHAVSEAFTVCINQLSDTSDITHVQPDLSHYQLLLVPTLCLRKDPRCDSAAAALRPFLDKNKKPQHR